MHPFRFYGERPVEWFEGANEGHAYDVTFKEKPTTQTRRALAKAYEAATKTGAAAGAPSKPWRWKGKVARLYLGERTANQHTRYFKAASGVMSALNEACGIESVVFRGSWGEPIGVSKWDRWSLAQADPPACCFCAEAPGTLDAQFERARRICQFGRKFVKKTEAEQEAARIRGDLTVIPTLDPVVAPSVPSGAAAKFDLSIAHYVVGSASGRVIARGSSFGTVAWIDDAGEVRGWGEEKLAAAWPQVSADGEVIWAALEGDTHRIVRVAVADGSAEVVWTSPADDPFVRSICPLGSDRLAFVSTKNIVLITYDGDGWASVDAWHPGEGATLQGTLLALHEGRGLVYVGYERVGVLRVDAGSLEELGRIEPPTPRNLSGVRTDGQRVTGVDSRTREQVELVNLDRLWPRRSAQPPTPRTQAD